MGLETLQCSKVYFDTNIFIYAIEDHDGYRDQVRALFKHLYEHNCQIVTSELTYAECLVKPLRENDETSIKNYEKNLIDSAAVYMNPVTLNVLRRAAIFRANYATKLPDAIHIATAIETGCTHVVSNDKQLPAVEGINFFRFKDIDN